MTDTGKTTMDTNQFNPEAFSSKNSCQVRFDFDIPNRSKIIRFQFIFFPFISTILS